MKRFLLGVGLIFLCGNLSSWAQTATPARPVDPTQPMPAQPVLPVTPAKPASPAEATPVAPASGTNTATAPSAPTESLSIVADSSLRQVMQELAQSWADTQDSNPQVPLTLTNAGTIHGKVGGGTVWDVVISADVQDMKDLTDKGLLFVDGQRTLARNTLVVYGRNALIKDDELEWFDLIGSEWKKVAMGNPELVASGRVAKRALEKHGLADEAHKPLFVSAGTEALALGFAAREQADAVFVYKTDLVGVTPHGFEVYPIKTEDAPPVFYTGGICRLAKNQGMARSFLDYCISEPARAIWKKYGFETN